MSSVARRAVLSVGKILVQPKVITKPFGGSTRHAVSQAMLAQKTDADDTVQGYGQQSDGTEGETFQMYTNNTEDTLSVNLENVSSDLQKDLIDKLGLFLTIEPPDLKKLRSVKFNNISEDVYRQKLHMPFRKLGYDSLFTRYNHDRGLASFKPEGLEKKVKTNYYRSGLPNKC